MSGGTNTLVIATFVPNNVDAKNEFNQAPIKDFKHAYPYGNNHWLPAAVVEWDWMKKYSLPDRNCHYPPSISD